MTALLAVTFVGSANAQASATENTTVAYATVLTPLSITKMADMNFGTLISSATAGTVVLDPNGTATHTNVVPFTGGSSVSPSPAQFEIIGQDGFTYTVTLPADNSVVLSNGASSTMSLTAFTHNAINTFGSIPQTFQVGATLNVNASQPAGIYVSEAFEVTVAYN